MKLLEAFSYYSPITEDDEELETDSPEQGDQDLESDIDELEDQLGDTQEIDITDLVQKNQEILDKMGEIQTIINSLSEDSVKKGDLEQQLKKAKDEILNKSTTNKNLIKMELEKRVPTPHEKIMLQTMSQYPYNIKLTDYFKPTSEPKDTRMGNAKPDTIPEKQTQEPKDEDYDITWGNIIKGYDEGQLRNSF